LWYYWRAVKDALVLPMQPISWLQDGFRHVSQIASAAEDLFIENGIVCEEYDEDDHFVGQSRNALHLHFEFNAIYMRVIW
jgi:hypothetical protein